MPTTNNPVRPWMKKSPPTKQTKTYASPTGARAGAGDIPENLYRLARWKKLRKQVLDTEPFCRECMSRKIPTPAQMVDHIQPIRLGGSPYDPGNLAPLCHRCHQRKRGRERHQQ